MWQTFTIDIIKKEAVGYSPNGINRNHDSSEAKIFLRATQGEVGVKFVAILLCNGEPYYVSDGAEFSVWYEGMSGAGNYTEINGRSPVVLEENALQIELIPQMIAVSGGGTLGVMLHEANGDIRKLFHLTYIVDEFPGYGSAAADGSVRPEHGPAVSGGAPPGKTAESDPYRYGAAAAGRGSALL